MEAAARCVLLIGVVSVFLLGVSGPASAKNAPGSPRWCKHHPHSKLAACQRTGGGPPPTTNITVSPNPVVETGDSDVYAVISVATDPVYAEQTVEIVSGLNSRCGGSITWITDQGSFSGSAASATIDDDGNATFSFFGASCAPGTVQLTADVEAGTDPTYTTTFTIDPPTPTI
jgi:hypothetical protein